MVPKVDRAMSLDEYLATLLPGASARMRAQVAGSGSVEVNAKVVEEGGAALAPGDLVRVRGLMRLKRLGLMEPAGSKTGLSTRAGGATRVAEGTRVGEGTAAGGGKQAGRRGAVSGSPDDLARADGGPTGRRLTGGVVVRYEDDEVIVIEKPVGLVTASPPAAVGAGGNRDTRGGRPPSKEDSVFDLLKRHVREGGLKRGGPRRRDDGGRGTARERDQGVYVIHRLDKEASGLLVFAKTPAAMDWLKEDFRAKRVHRVYMAVAEGAVGKVGERGTIQSFLAEDGRGRMRSTDRDGPGPGPQREAPPARRGRGGPGKAGSGGGGPGGDARADEPKLAVTHYEVAAVGVGRGNTQGWKSPAGWSLLRVKLDTGRKNQIRVHFAEKGHPLVGDERFGAKTNPIGRLGLHAAELAFTHAGTGRELRFESPAPTSFWRVVGVKRGEDAGAVDRESEVSDLKPQIPGQATSQPAAGPAGAESDPAPGARLETSWDRVAGWYDAMVEGGGAGNGARGGGDGAPRGAGAAESGGAGGEGGDRAARGRGNDHYEEVILPGALRLLSPRPGMRVLDLACGQGILCRRLAELGVRAVGTDASPRLIEAAGTRGRRGGETGKDRERGGARGEGENPRYFVSDARELGAAAPAAGLTPGSLDAVACIMALANIDPLDPVLRAASALLAPGGAFVFVVTHPAFRAHGQTSWGWDAEKGVQYRRVDGYLSPGQTRIAMHPGKDPTIKTWTFHRPLQTYARLLAEAGLLIERLEEWPGKRESTSGPRAAEENRARREVPLFLGVRAVKR